jgi:hypothetical protein
LIEEAIEFCEKKKSEWKNKKGCASNDAIQFMSDVEKLVIKKLTEADVPDRSRQAVSGESKQWNYSFR